MQARSQTFNYIDGFAGPWAVADEDNYSDSSFDQAVRTLLTVKEALETRGPRRYSVRFCLCEKDPQRFQRLKHYAESQRDLDIHVFEGAFEKKLGNIAAVCSNGFSFTFIDPTGFNLGSLEIADFLARQNGEFLLNFMSEHINRYPTVESVQGTFGRLLAATDWRARFDTLPSSLSNETRILMLLKDRLKQLRAGRYMPDFEILNARRERRQMRLILGTNSAAGVEVFRDVQARIERQQFEIRERLQRPEQEALFSLAEARQSNSGVGCAANLSRARDAIMEQLQAKGDAAFEDLIAPTLEVAAIRKTDMKDLLNRMRGEGSVAFDLPGRTKKPDGCVIIRLAA